jgi:DNA-binding CsgD family transcriptional regulator
MMINYSNLHARPRPFLASDATPANDTSGNMLAGLLLCILNEAQLPFAIVRRDGSLVLANQLFKSWFVYASPHGSWDHLRMTFGPLNDEIEQAIDNGKTSTLPLDDENKPAMLHVFPLQDELEGSAAEDCAAVVIHKLGKAATPDKDCLNSMFGLTARESEIAADVVKGSSVAKIAEKNGVTTGTVRVQLKSIFRKTGVRSQVELASKLYV